MAEEHQHRFCSFSFFWVGINFRIKFSFPNTKHRRTNEIEEEIIYIAQHVLTVGIYAYNDVPSQDLVIFRFSALGPGKKKKKRKISKSASSHSFGACSNSFERKERKREKKCRLFTWTASLNVYAMGSAVCARPSNNMPETRLRASASIKISK